MAWDDVAGMVAGYQGRLAGDCRLWSLFGYRDAAQYARKLAWYARALRQLPDDASVLDLGCGTGELLARVELPAGYRGIDAVPAFVAAARARFPARRFDVLDALRDELDRVDVVAMVGVLGLSPRPLGLIERAAGAARQALVFDYLSADRAAVRGPELRYLSDADVHARLATGGLEIVSETTIGSSVAVWAHRRSAGAGLGRATGDKRTG